MTDKHFNDWKKYLNPSEVKFQLLCSSLYITAYDLLIEAVVGKLKDFYTIGFDGDKYLYHEDYYIKVKSLHKKDIVIASSIWLQNSQVISMEDVEKIKELKNYRNILAHELSKIISDSQSDVNVGYFEDLKTLYKKIHLWWFVEVELSTNPLHDDVDIENLDYDEVLALVMLPMEYIVSMVKEEVVKREG